MHGIVRYVSAVYVFGGSKNPVLNPEDSKSAEIYDIVEDIWKETTPMPVGADEASCVRVHDKIFVTSSNFALISFTPWNEQYTTIINDFSVHEYSRALWRINEKTYLCNKDSGLELDNEGQVL